MEPLSAPLPAGKKKREKRLQTRSGLDTRKPEGFIKTA
jgi:hypothetical protein